MPDSPGLEDSAIGLVNCVFNLPDEQMKFCGQYKLQKNCNAHQFFFFGLVGMTVGPVQASCSLPFGQPVKLTFFVL